IYTILQEVGGLPKQKRPDNESSWFGLLLFQEYPDRVTLSPVTHSSVSIPSRQWHAYTLSASCSARTSWPQE
ncbi:MAG: hypothetical protein SO414_02275, partial [Bacteroidaceae bacterium]|nr:hypothetical protein [Bacteroidaceae bacterium]